MTVQEAIKRAAGEIERRDAETLLLHQLQRDRAWLLAHRDVELEAGQSELFSSNVAKRARHWPLQYLTGVQEFFGLPFHVSPAVLIPRPETEFLVEAVLAWAEKACPERPGRGLQIVDVGTGSGAIALALAHKLPEAAITALDISTAVQDTVQANAGRLGLEGRIRFLVSDLLDVLGAEMAAGLRFDVVVSNPPYVPLADAPALQPEVRDFEPHLALFAGDDGLEVYRRLIPQAWTALRPGGLLAMEFGFGQKKALMALVHLWRDVRVIDDYAGIPRVLCAIRP